MWNCIVTTQIKVLYTTSHDLPALAIHSITVNRKGNDASIFSGKNIPNYYVSDIKEINLPLTKRVIRFYYPYISLSVQTLVNLSLTALFDR